MEINNSNQSKNSTEANTQSLQTSVNNKKSSFPIILIILIILVVAGGAYYFLATKPTNIVIAPSITPSVVPSVTQMTASPTIEPTISPNSNFFSSKKLGISFLYGKFADASDKSSEIGLLEASNKVYVYVGRAKPETGQSVEIFQKSPTDSLEQAIKKQFLSGISENDCFVKIATDKNLPSNFTKATIGYPVPTNSDQPYFTSGEKCPENYKESNGLAYFLADNNHPDKFLYFSIGQYPIPAETGINTTLWQDTIKFLN